METLDYGIIGNCRSAALVSRCGSIDWLCFPDFDSASVFAALLDEEAGGCFGFVLPEGCKANQEYLRDTNVLRTILETEGGSFEVIDFMPRYHIASDNSYMPPEVYRLLRPLSGAPRIRLRFHPRMDYARRAVLFEKQEKHLYCSAVDDPAQNMYLYSSLDYDAILERREIALEKEEFLLLAHNQKLIPVDLDRVHLELERTRLYWINWASRSVRLEKYRDIVSRSLLVLKLMTFEQSGAILAAATTSIPETVGEVRNWDYRYCWLRDASMSMNTLLDMGHPHAAQRFLRFVTRIVRSKNDSFQIMYGIRGERTLTEEVLDHLSGYAGSLPVRIGNAAYLQKQNDVFGYLLDVVNNYYRYFGGSLDDIEEMWEIVKKIARTVSQEWRNPDCSIWEFRNRSEHFVFSKIMCWVAMDRAARISSFLGRKAERDRYRREADAIREDVFHKGWNARLQSFTQSYESEGMDASLLLMEQYGFIRPDDDRFVKTVRRVRAELFRKGLMYRYKSADDFGLPRSAFTICAFWLVRALCVTGEREEAAAIFDGVVARANHVGLLSEDIDFDTGRQLGNFPQAYSHLALIDTALLLDDKKYWPKFIRP